LTTVLDTRVMGMRHAKMGTGFVYSVINKKRVLIGTNEHIVSGGTEFIVRTALNAEYRARVIEADKERDIAVLEIIPNGKEFADDEFIPIAFGDSQTVSAGEAVIIIGHPREYYYSVQHGVFSATRTIESGREKSFLFSQTDIAVDPGSSGSPLFNIEGKMIGIIALRLKNLSNASFAIPVNDFLKFAEKAKARIAQ
jgi:serine protease Do